MVLQVVALLNGIDPGMLISVCTVETNLRNVTNHYDGNSPSYGVCQVKLSTARLFRPKISVRELMKPEVNADIAAKYLKWQLARYDGDFSCTVAAYNAGSCNKKSGSIRNIKYVNKVRRVYGTLPHAYRVVYEDRL